MVESKGGQCVSGSDGCIIDLSRAFPESFRLKQLRQNYSTVSLNNSCLTQIYCFCYRREVLLMDCFYDEFLELFLLTAAAS
jgi:hypothetical protein